MRVSLRLGLLALVTLVLTSGLLPASADDPTSAAPAPAASAQHQKATGIADRLFLAFAQDAAIVPSQWWEGQIEFDDRADNFPVSAWIGRGVVAFQPFKNIEIGGRFGIGNSKAPGDLPDGTGATDLDLYAKYFFGNAVDRTDFTAGLLLTVPTGDDTAGLGYNSFAEQIFGGVRYRLDKAIIGGHVGVRLNGNGKYQGSDIEGKTSFELAVDTVIPMSSELSIVGEAHVETERFQNQDSIAEILGGVNWKAFGRGMIRGAVGAGLTDAAPNFRVIVSYAYTF